VPFEIIVGEEKVKLQAESTDKLLLVAATTGYQTQSFAEAARRQGIEVVLATDRCHVLEDPWQDHAIAVKFADPQPVAGIEVDGIVAVADRPTLIAALTAEAMGLPWHTPDAVRICRDKRAMRKVFESAGLLVPRNFSVPVDSEPTEVAGRVEFPCVLKPTGHSGSRGVIRADNPEEFRAAFMRIRQIIQTVHEEGAEAIQIEAYIDGREFALEGLMTRGQLQVLAIFDKPDPLAGPFFEETIYVTPSRETAEVQQAIAETTRRAVAALGLYHGPIHAEMRVTPEGVFMLEVAARPIGGLCARAIRFANGLTLEDVVVLHAVGRMPEDLSPGAPALGLMMIPIPRGGIYQSVRGFTEDPHGEVIITAKAGQKLVPLPEGASYLGFIFARGDSAADVESLLRRLHGELEFEILTALDIVSN
jgi:biotin carboxylase